MKVHNKRVRLGVVLLFTILTVTRAIAFEPQLELEPTSVEHILPIEEVRRFTTAIGHVKNYYVEEAKDKEIFENAIRGMLQGLDPHSAYLNEEDVDDLRTTTSGQFGGIGIEVTSQGEFVKVVSPIDDTPAFRAGIKPGDLIVRVNNESVTDMTLREAVNRMKGEKGTDVELTIVREGEKEPLRILLKRAIIQIHSVKSRLLTPSYGYIRVSVFQLPSSSDLREAVQKLQEEADGKLKGIVLDLRNNPGGLLDSAVEIADAFLNSEQLGENQLIVYTDGRVSSAKISASATPGDLLDGLPMVVLINEGSASASEIVAGALQDHKRAVLVGKKSFGKGSVQTVLPLDDKTAVKITTARYFTPLGQDIQAKGISPDITVDALVIPEAGESNGHLLLLKEADLRGHLDANGESKAQEISIQDVKDTEGVLLINSDYQLYQALSLLKGLSIIQKPVIQ